MSDTSDHTELKQNVCKICNKSFEKLAVLQRHVKNVHKVLPDYKQPSKDCPTCGEKCRTRVLLRAHVETEHGVKQQIESLSFETEQEFLTWKAAEEDAKCSSFTKVRGTPVRQVTDSSSNYNVYYKCNRDGCYESIATKRQKKSQGTSKIQANCTAGLTVKYSATGLQVHYCSTHYGHDMEPGHIRIPESGRKTILEELKQKKPHLDILDAIRSRAENADHVSRIHLTTRKDLRNISAAAGLNEEHELHDNDMLDYSVEETIVCPSSKEIKIATYISELNFLLTQAKTNFQYFSEEQVTSLLADIQTTQKKVVEEADKELRSTSLVPPSSASTRCNIEPQVRNFIFKKKKRSLKKK